MIAAAIMCGQLCIAGRLLNDADPLVCEVTELANEFVDDFSWGSHLYVARRSCFHIVVSSL